MFIFNNLFTNLPDIFSEVTNYGDKDYAFCVQSCCKPISYLMAAEEEGFDFVHNHVTFSLQFYLL